MAQIIAIYELIINVQRIIFINHLVSYPASPFSITPSLSSATIENSITVQMVPTIKQITVIEMTAVSVCFSCCTVGLKSSTSCRLYSQVDRNHGTSVRLAACHVHSTLVVIKLVGMPLTPV